MRLTDRQREQLRKAAVFGNHHIDQVTAAIQRENPGAFLKETERDQRIFFDEPMAQGFILPHRAHVRRWVPRHEQIAVNSK